MTEPRLATLVHELLDDPELILSAEGPPAARCAALLDRLLSDPAVQAGVVWQVDPLGRLAVLCQRSCEGLNWHGDVYSAPPHPDRLASALRQGQAVCLDVSAESSPIGSDCLVAAAPIFAGETPSGALEVFARATQSPAERRALLQAVEDLCGLLARALGRRRPTTRAVAATRAHPERDQFALGLHRSLNVAEVAGVAVNDGRLLLGCDRLSLAHRRGARTRITAVSGQDQVESRANLVRAMAHLADLVMQSGIPLDYDGTTGDWPPQLEDALAAFLAESRSRSVRLVPLRRTPPLVPVEGPESTGSKPAPQPIVGCLIIEQTTDSPRETVSAESVDFVAGHVAAALSNAQQHEQIFLLPLWRTLGRGFEWLRGRRLWTAIAIVLAILVGSFALRVIPWEYRVTADGVALPVVRHEIFAPWDGDVKEIFVVSGQRVLKGDPLVRLESDDLDSERVTLDAEVKELSRRRDALRVQAAQAAGRGDRDEELRLEGELVQTQVRLRGAEESLRVLDERIEALTIRAPKAGVVATFQLRQTLEFRPVHRGEVLLEVMDENGPWQIELEIPEHRMGHVLSELAASESHTLPVRYVPATAVDRTCDATLTEIATRSDESPEGGMIVEAFAAIDPDDLPQRRIGSEVTAKIECGRCSLAYALFGDVYEFLQRHLWW